MTRKVIVATGSGRLDHPSGVFRLERRTLGEKSTGDDWHQSMLTDERMVDGEPGLMISVRGETNDEAEYYLTMQEAKLLAAFLTQRSAAAEPETWLTAGTPEAEAIRSGGRTRWAPSNGDQAHGIEGPRSQNSNT